MKTMANANALVTTVTGVALATVVGAAVASQPVGEIKRIEGSAMISQGAQYVTAREGMQLHELDRILVLEDSTALLHFADGCTHNMSEQELLTLGPQSTCVQPEPADAKAIERSAISQLEAGEDDDDRAGALMVGGAGAGGAAAIGGGGAALGGAMAGLAPLGLGAAAGLGWAASNGVGSDDRDPLSPQ
jgi:hypothetical protein